MADEPTEAQDALDELAWRRQRAILHGAWDEAARYAALLAAPAPVASGDVAPEHAAPVGRDCPVGYPLKGKGKGTTRLYHVPGGAWYPRVAPDRCFATEAAARAAGYRRARR